MKKLFTLLLMVVMAIITYSQAPQKLSYQAVIRNSGGQLVTNHAVGIRATILQGSPSGSVVYQETFNSLTNGNGLVSIEIGGGTLVSGNFSTINWASGSYYLRTETDPSGGTSYTISGTSQLISVPYALHAKNAASYTETDPVFGAAPAKAITSGLITNWNTAYGWGNHAGLYRPVSYVPAWSEITSKPTTVSGYGISDAVTLAGNQTITGLKTFNPDILVNGLTIGKGKNNVVSNTAFGLQALNSNTSGVGNTAFGCKALYSNSTGEYNSAYGDSALFTNFYGYDNAAFGAKALYKNSYGIRNTAIGCKSLEKNTIGNNNTAIGFSSLLQNTEGLCNTACGVSLIDNTTGNLNSALGYNALPYNKTGNKNTAVGSYAGLKSLADGNVFIGYQAGYYETGSNKLFIDNQQRANETDARSKALIYGVFNEDPWNQVVALNARVGIGTSNPGTRLSIVGLTSASAGSALIISGNNVYIQSSIRSLKDDIQPLNDDFGKILNTSPVSFTDKNTGMPGIGYIAEDFENAGLQNLLVYENGKLVSLRYDLISVYNLEVIKKQQEQIEKQQKMIEDQQKQLDEIREALQLLSNEQ